MNVIGGDRLVENEEVLTEEEFLESRDDDAEFGPKW
jgi:hypothetical protein